MFGQKSGLAKTFFSPKSGPAMTGPAVPPPKALQKFQFILSEWFIFVTLDRTFEHLSAFENAIERYQNYARLSTVDPPTKCHNGVLVTG